MTVTPAAANAIKAGGLRLVDQRQLLPPAMVKRPARTPTMQAAENKSARRIRLNGRTRPRASSTRIATGTTGGGARSVRRFARRLHQRRPRVPIRILRSLHSGRYVMRLRSGPARTAPDGRTARASTIERARPAVGSMAVVCACRQITHAGRFVDQPRQVPRKPPEGRKA